MIKIGITGGIGSGKSTVCRAFGAVGRTRLRLRLPGAPADVRGRRPESRCKRVVRRRSVRRRRTEPVKYVAGRIFSGGTLRERLNAVVHPAAAEDFARWAERQQGPYVIEEAAILFESGAYRQMDKVVTVTAPRVRADPPYLPARRRRPGSGPRAHGRPDRRGRTDRPRRLRDPLRRRGTRPAEYSGTATGHSAGCAD